MGCDGAVLGGSGADCGALISSITYNFSTSNPEGRVLEEGANSKEIHA